MSDIHSFFFKSQTATHESEILIEQRKHFHLKNQTALINIYMNTLSIVRPHVCKLKTEENHFLWLHYNKKDVSFPR